MRLNCIADRLFSPSLVLLAGQYLCKSGLGLVLAAELTTRILHQCIMRACCGDHKRDVSVVALNILLSETCSLCRDPTWPDERHIHCRLIKVLLKASATNNHGLIILGRAIPSGETYLR